MSETSHQLGHIIKQLITGISATLCSKFSDNADRIREPAADAVIALFEAIVQHQISTHAKNSNLGISNQHNFALEKNVISIGFLSHVPKAKETVYNL